MAMFDNYCKTVIMNRARRYGQREQRRITHEHLMPDVDGLEDCAIYIHETETYTMLYGDVRADFHCVLLYNAVLQLKTRGKAVIFLKH
ncbi:MAG: hypothetical protein RR873_08220, partial [Christensenella sp.]